MTLTTFQRSTSQCKIVMKILAKNKSAYFNYFVVDKFEAGIVLLGSEVKSIINGGISLKESYVRIEGGELWLWNAHVAKYKFSNLELDETRTRKLLVKKSEIKKLALRMKKETLTMVPLSVYLGHNKVKIEVGLVKGKKKFDKRETLKQREVEKETLQKIKYK